MPVTKIVNTCINSIYLSISMKFMKKKCNWAIFTETTTVSLHSAGVIWTKRSLGIPSSGINWSALSMLLYITFHVYFLCTQHIIKHKRYLFITPKEEVIGAIVKYSISINDYVSGHHLDIKLLSMAMIIKSTTSSQVKSSLLWYTLSFYEKVHQLVYRYNTEK